MAMFHAVGSTSSNAYNVQIQGPSGPDQDGNAFFEIDGPLPPTGPYWLTLPNPPRKYEVYILSAKPVQNSSRTAVIAAVNLIT